MRFRQGGTSRGRLTVALAFLVGALIGAAVAATVVYRHWSGWEKEWDALKLFELAAIADDIYAGEGVGRADQIVQVLPAFVPHLVENQDDTEWALRALWRVRDLYEAHDIEIPESISPLLETLPPRPATACPLLSSERPSATESTGAQ